MEEQNYRGDMFEVTVYTLYLCGDSCSLLHASVQDATLNAPIGQGRFVKAGPCAGKRSLIDFKFGGSS